MPDTIDIFIPCRTGSQRIKNKNIRKIGPYKFGLVERKIEQLRSIPNTRIVLSTDDKNILSWADKLKIPNLFLDHRDSSLASDFTLTDDLIRYSKTICKSDYILWTHVTSPFISTQSYVNAISIFFDKKSQGYDSLVTVEKIQKFLWSTDGPQNYNPTEKGFWPNTQDIDPLFEITSGIFLFDKESKSEFGRIGSTPYFHELNKIENLDVDNIEDFMLTEKLIGFGL